MTDFRNLIADLKRSRELLVPEAFQFLWETARFIVPYGGRSSAKSWSVVRVLLVLGMEQRHLILCARESQSSIKESAYRLLCNQIVELGLDDFYSISADKIQGRNGTEFIFEGLYRNAERLKSYEGISIVWVEEAHRVSERSWEDFVPTVRKPGSRFYITFNPSQADDPVWLRFVASKRPDVIARRVTWRDNPHLSAETIAEKDWCAATDFDQYRHVWEGEFRTVTEAQILRGKFVSEDFEIDASWSGPHFGLDFGFSQDPSAGTCCYIDDQERVLYIAAEYWKLGADIDRLPGDLEGALPGISTHMVYCDSARPESISYIQRHGISRAQATEKWNGSIDDGIAYLRAFSRIVIHPSCVHTLDEANRYSFKVDRLTGNPLPEVEDKHNHCIDSIRYALSALIRSKASFGYFSRRAMLAKGEPVEPEAIPPTRVLVTIAPCDRVGTAVGAIYWASSPRVSYPLRVLDWDIIELDEALSGAWIARVIARVQQLRGQWHAAEAVTRLWVESGEFFTSLDRAFAAALPPAVLAGQERPPFDLCRVESKWLISADRLPLTTLDQRAAEVRSLVNGGHFVKLAREAYVRQLAHRSTTSNHLTAQLLGYRPGAPDSPCELVAAFLLGCLITRDARSGVPAPSEERPLATAAAADPAPPPKPLPPPGMLLTVGPHTIDGVLVEVQPPADNPTATHTWWPCKVGGHIVDNKIALATNPAAGIVVPLRGLR